jgi:hypothetical protein
MCGGEARGWFSLSLAFMEIFVRRWAAKLQAGVDVAGAAAFRQVTGNIFEFTGLLAFRASLGGFGRRHGKTALAALPLGLQVHGSHVLSPQISGDSLIVIIR